MRAESRIKNLTYVVEPSTFVTDAQGHKLGASPGLRIVFGGRSNFFFESESIRDVDPKKQKAKQKRVEEFLRNHQDNGVWYHIVDAPTVQVDTSVQEGRVSTANVEKPQPVCVMTVSEPGQESRLCGKPAGEGSEFCTEHIKEVEKI